MDITPKEWSVLKGLELLGWEWIVRDKDEDGDLCVFDREPVIQEYEGPTPYDAIWGEDDNKKHDDIWVCPENKECTLQVVEDVSNIDISDCFQDKIWKEQPHNIKKLIRGNQE